jgi:DNA-binding Lrp family transcriptional regulator
MGCVHARDERRSAIIWRVDATDHKILAVLQDDGRVSVTELAQQVGLSVSACARRVQALHRDGVVAGYRAIVDPGALGLAVEVLASVTMAQEDAATIERFEAALADIDEVHHAERLFGDPDYLIRLVTRDVNHYQQLRDTRLGVLPGVQTITSNIVMRRIVDHRPLAQPRR